MLICVYILEEFASACRGSDGVILDMIVDWLAQRRVRLGYFLSE